MIWFKPIHYSHLLRRLPDGAAANVNSLQLQLLHAVNTLRCLTIPKCYPTISCMDDEEPMQIPIDAHWERQAFCMSDLRKKKSSSNDDNNGRCLVYSFGINGNTEWEQKMNEEFNCDVFAFDPTSDLPTNIAPGVTFHQIGLQGDGVDVSKTHSDSYAALDPTKLLTLGEIRKRLGHTERKIDILRLDCEGCEWGALKELACSGESQLVEQLMVEMHFQKNLGLATDEDILIASDAIACLERERWGIASMEQSGCGPSDAHYHELALNVIRGNFFLLYVTMKRLPEGKVWDGYPSHNHDFALQYKTYDVYQSEEEEEDADAGKHQGG